MTTVDAKIVTSGVTVGRDGDKKNERQPGTSKTTSVICSCLNLIGLTILEPGRLATQSLPCATLRTSMNFVGTNNNIATMTDVTLETHLAKSFASLCDVCGGGLAVVERLSSGHHPLK